MERLLVDAMFEVPDDTTIDRVVMDEESVENGLMKKTEGGARFIRKKERATRGDARDDDAGRVAATG